MVTTRALPAASDKGRRITLWILSGLVALVLSRPAAPSWPVLLQMVELFAKVGLGQWFRYFTGFWKWRPASAC